MTRKLKEAITPPETIEALLRVAGTNVVLVGGQSLSVWVEYYDVAIHESMPAISADVDFLTRSAADRATVKKFADALGGSSVFPNIRSLTALVGQAIREVEGDEYLNVDVIWDVLGVPAKKVIKHAVRFDMGEISYMVMHPMHVLVSRITNLYKVADKQNNKGISQLELAIQVTREFLRAEVRRYANDPDVQDASDKTGRSVVQKFISEIERQAKKDSGKKIAARYGVHIADAIDPTLISSQNFWEIKWPMLKALMSPNYAAHFCPPANMVASTPRGKLQILKKK